MRDTKRSELISAQLRQIAEQAIAHPDRVFTTLIHRMDVDFLREAYHRLRKDGAAGLSGVTAKDYGRNLEANLTDLHERLKGKRYVAPPDQARVDRQGGWQETADRDIGIRRQDCPESGIDADGGGVRAGFSPVLIWCRVWISGSVTHSLLTRPSERSGSSA